MLTVHEIYRSIQGETSRAGLPCVFVRLTACDLRCSWCDTAHAFTGGTQMDVHDVARQASEFGIPLITITGGEPLLQEEVLPLISILCDRGFTVLVETSGAHDVTPIDPRAHIILDLKCPSSGEMARNRWENIPHLKSKDEVKFVIASREDCEWAESIVKNRLSSTPSHVLFSYAEPIEAVAELKPFPPSHRRISPAELAEFVLDRELDVRVLPQIHKMIWMGARDRKI